MFKGTLYIITAQIVFVFSNFILQVFLGRKLGPELYGVFGVINALILMNEYILLKGVFDTLSKFVAEKEKAAKTILGITLKVVGVVGVIIGLAYYLFAHSIAGLMNDLQLSKYFQIIAVIIPINCVSTIFLGVLNGLRRFRDQALVHMVFSITRCIAVIALVAFGFSILGAFVGLIIAELFRLVVSRIVARSIKADSRFDSKGILRFGLQALAIALISSVVMYVDLLAVKVLLKNDFQTGLYNAAVTVSKVMLLFIVPISIVILPTISKLIYTNDMEQTSWQIQQALRLLMILVLPITLMIVATSGNCLSLLFGKEYLSASMTLKILIVGAMFLSAKLVLFNIIMASGLPRYVIYIGILSVVVDIVLILTLVNKFGISGAAAASTITHLLGFLISYAYVSSRFTGFKIPIFAIRIGLAALIVYLVAAFYTPSGIMLLFYYGILLFFFFFLLVIMKEIKLQDLKLAPAKAWKTDRTDRMTDAFPQ